MIRFMTFALLVSAMGFATWTVNERAMAQNGENRKPLDLPSGGAGDNDEEEDEPESIVFYGSEYEGDGFFWCIDRSCSMGWGGGAPIATLKQEMTQAVQSLTSRADFSMVAFATNYVVWSQQPQKASPASKSSAITWINGLSPIEATCIAPAGVKTIQIANLSSKRRKAVILVGDGIPECPPPYTAEQGAQVLADLTSANYNRDPIHTIFIAASEIGVQLMTQIAAANNGTFTHVQ